MDVQEEIYQAIDNMVGRRLDRQNLTTQSEGIVVGSSVKGDGIYHVKINGNVYKVKDGIGLRPKLNDIVWVCIPNNDWGKAYICAGKRFDGGDPPVQNYVEANPKSLATATLTKLRVNKTTYEIPRDVRDVQQNGTSVVENHIANIRAPRDVVDEQGHSLINEYNQAVIPTVASGVNDVLVDGTSVVTNHTANITMPTIPVIDVKVNNTSVVSGRIANVTVPTIEANPSQSATTTLTKLKVDNTVYAVPSGSSSTLAGLTDTNISSPTDGQYLSYNATSNKWENTTGGGSGTTVIANPSAAATDDLTKVQIGNTVYDIPGDSGGGSVYLNTIYDETERQVGYYYGRPLYQRTWDLGANFSFPNNSWTTVSAITGLSDIILVNSLGSQDQSDTAVVKFDTWFDSSNNTIKVRSLRTDNEYVRYITLQYAKNTDSVDPNPQIGNVIYLPTIYSEEERQVGVWTDGKPLYQKTVFIGTPSYNTYASYSHGISDIGELVSSYGSCINNGTNQLPVPLPNQNTQYSIFLGNIDSTSFHYQFGSGFNNISDFNVTLQYTKTTDTPGSAFPNMSWPVTDVLVNGTSVLDGTVAKITGSGGGSTVTVTPILTSGTKIATIDVDSADFDLYAPDGDTVEWTGTLTTGTEIGRLTINGSENIIYAPAGGSGSGDVVDVYVNGESVLDSDNIAQIDLTGYQTNLQSEIDRIYDVCVSMGSTPPSHGFADVLLTALYTIGGGKKYVDIDSTSTTNMRYFGHAKEALWTP